MFVPSAIFTFPVYTKPVLYPICREKLRRSNIGSSFNDLNALIDKIENNSVVQFDSRCVTKITILTKVFLKPAIFSLMKKLTLQII